MAPISVEVEVVKSLLEEGGPTYRILVRGSGQAGDPVYNELPEDDEESILADLETMITSNAVNWNIENDII